MPTRTLAQCTPSLGMVSIFWSRCCQSIIWPNSCGQTFFYLRDKEGGEVAECRNGIIDGVLAFDQKVPISHVFWIDDDVLVFPLCVLELIKHQRDVAMGVYFFKRPGSSEILIYPEESGGTLPFTPDTVQEVHWGHMGLTLIRTEIYKRMRDELDLGTDKYGRPQWYRTSSENEIYRDEKDVIHLGYTEDNWFYQHYHQLKNVQKPLVDMTKHCFGWHYDAQPDQGYPQKQWAQWINGDKITWELPNGNKVIWD